MLTTWGEAVGSRFGGIASSLRHYFTDRTTLLLALGCGCARSACALLQTALADSQETAVLFISSLGVVLVTSLFTIFTCILAMVWTHLRSGHSRDGLIGYLIAAAGLLLILILSLTGAFTSLAPPWDAGIFGALYAISVTGIDLIWMCVLAQHGLARGLGGFVGAMVFVALIDLATQAASTTVRIVMGMVVLVISVTVMWYVAHRTGPQTLPRRDLTIRATLHEIKPCNNVIITMVVLECAVSFLNGFFFGRSLFSDSSLIFVIGPALGALGVLGAHLMLTHTPDIRRTYLILFPLLAATIALLPFAGSGQNPLLGAALTLFYTVLSTWTMYLMLSACIQMRLNAAMVFGFIIVLERLGHLVFVPIGTMLGYSALEGGSQVYPFVVLAVVYVLAILLAYLSREGRRRKQDAPEQARIIENRPEMAIAIEVNDMTVHQATDSALATVADAFEARADELATKHFLTPRETEILALIARGRSAAFIGCELRCSTDTVRTHAKSIYAKLGVHSKQEVIDLFRPE